MAQILLLADPRPLVERLGQDFFRNAPKRPGVYLMRDAQEQILYVGKAKNLKQRLSSYRVANPDRMPRRHLRLLRQVARIELQECADELAALAKEAELLLALKPKFNRAGVWLGTPRFLVWRCSGTSTSLAVTEIPDDGWQAFGPFGGGILHLRAALVRLLWYALNPAAGASTMPHGWVHGRFGEIATLTVAKAAVSSEVEHLLGRLFDGDMEGFASWVGEQTKLMAQVYDLEVRAADLETVTGFMQTKARRPSAFISANRKTAYNPAEGLLDWALGG